MRNLLVNGSSLGKEALHLTDYRDADGGPHLYISEMPFIILEANSNKIRKLRQEAINQQIPFVDFTDTMTIGTYQEQIERTQATQEENLIYYGID